MPSLWAAEMGSASPKPRLGNSPSSVRTLAWSILLATSSVGRSIFRRAWATWRSRLTMPSRASTTNRIRSAAFMPKRIWSSTCSVSWSWSSMPIPPVSTSSMYPSSSLSPRAMGTEIRSRVTPGVGSTIEIRRPARQFSNELLPTFGRPTMATVGRGMGESSYPGRRGGRMGKTEWGMERVGNDLPPSRGVGRSLFSPPGRRCPRSGQMRGRPGRAVRPTPGATA